jgi:hypothetical protein
MTLRPLLIAAAVVAVTACSGNGDEDSTTSTPSTTTSDRATTTDNTTISTDRTSTTTTASTSSTTTATSGPASTSTAPVSTAPANEDWRLVVEELGQRRQDLYATPDVTRIVEVCADGSQCAQQLEVQIGDLATKGWHVQGADPFVVLDARLERFEGDTLEDSLLVTVVAVIDRQDDAGSIVDQSGAVMAAIEVDTSAGFNAQGRILLARVGPSDDPWRIVSQDELPEVPE